MVTHQSKILPLENGDRLSRVEFERRYQAMPEHQKAELIEGRVYIASPVRIIHGQPNNEPQPDALLLIEDGQSQIDVDDYIQGAPELIVKIAASTASYDLEKLKVYRRNGVQEYLVWQVSDRIFDWFRLRDGEYIKLQPNKQNIIKSEVFPGLWLGIDYLLNYELAEVIKTVQQGLNTIEHQDFILGINNQ